MRFSVQRGAAVAASLLLAVACSTTDSAQVAVGPVSTTPPLTVPAVLDQPETQGTTGPLESRATSVPEPTAPAEPTAVAEPTAAPTAVVVAEATTQPATAAPATAALAVPAGAAGATIALGDFEVVNLVTRATQNITELSPSGPTMLWFWAPH